MAPKGSPLAALRSEAHNAFDVHWQFLDGTESSRQEARTRLYEWLAKQLSISPKVCHFGMFDEVQCRRAIEVCRTKTPRI